MVDKKTILEGFVNTHKCLPEQRSEQWINDRKFNIGGSEMGIITGDNPYKNVRGLIEQHLGLSVFKGNINTYWGTLLEDYVIRIVKEKWGAEIYELGSLPGVIGNQKYSPDGLLYLSFLDAIVLLEIKNAARRLANGKIPNMYKSQIFTGLDTIQIADMAMFIDVMFRRCKPDDFGFNVNYDHSFHGKKTVNVPIALCMLVFYATENVTPDATKIYQNMNDEYGLSKEEYMDLGECAVIDLETIMELAVSKKIDVEFSPLYEDPISLNIISEEAMLRHHDNNNKVIGIMPVKLFRFDILPVRRYDWRKMRKLKDKSNNSYVSIYEEKINNIVDTIKSLDPLTPSQQKEELNKLYPPRGMPKVPDSLIAELISSLMF